MKTKILITGGTGFIGSHLSSNLLRDGYEVTSLSRKFKPARVLTGETEAGTGLKNVFGDIRDKAVVESVVTDASVIFHKAAAVGVAESGQFVRDFTETNIIGTANLVDVLKTGKHQVEKIILGSSISVYGEGNYSCQNCGTVRPEIRISQKVIDDYADWNPRCPSCSGHIEPTLTGERAERRGESIYAITKKTQEDLLISTCRLLGIDLVILRYCTVIGAGQSEKNPYSRFIKILLEGHSPMVNEDGRQSRDFVHIDDVIVANIQALKSAPPGISIYNIGSGIQTDLIDFVLSLKREVANMHGISSEEIIVSQKLIRGEIRHCQADCSLAMAELNFSQPLDIIACIKNLIEGFTNHEKINIP